MVSSRHRPSLKRVLTFALVLPAAIAIGACGGSSTSPATTTTSSTGSTTGTNALHQAFDTALRKNLLSQQNLSKAQTDCVITKLDQTLSDTDIQRATQGSFPPSVLKAAGKAGRTCALRHP